MKYFIYILVFCTMGSLLNADEYHFRKNNGKWMSRTSRLNYTTGKKGGEINRGPVRINDRLIHHLYEVDGSVCTTVNSGILDVDRIKLVAIEAVSTVG